MKGEGGIVRTPSKTRTSAALSSHVSGYFHQAGVLVLGDSLEAALAATLLVRRGVEVLWPGPPSPSTTKLGEGPAQTAPAIFPAPERAPSLMRALADAGLDKEVRRLLRPVPLQLLGERIRVTLPADAPGIPGAVQTLAAIAPPRHDTQPIAPPEQPRDEEPSSNALGFFGRRTRAVWESRRLDALPSPASVLGEIADAFESLLFSGLNARRSAVELLGAPYVLPGGVPHLVELLHRRFLEMGGRTIENALQKPFSEFRLGWRGVRCRLATGSDLSGHVLVTSMDEVEIGRLANPGPDRAGLRTETRLRGGESPFTDELVRMSLAVRSKGLPMPLGPVAIVRAPAPLLMERRPMGGGVDELAVFWRRGGRAPADGEASAMAALGAVLPFFEGHVVARAPAQFVPNTGRPAATAHPRTAWRSIVARPNLWPLGGPDGAALVARGIVEIAARAAPRKAAAE